MINPATAMKWHQLKSSAVLQELGTDPVHGLSASEAARRLAKHGRNELIGTGIKSPWQILWEQLTGLMVVILIIATLASALLGDYKDAFAIGAIVVLNALLGFSQEYRAEKAMAALRAMAVPSVRVRRDGEVTDIPAFLLVPGDVVVLEAGNLVAADCRIFESAGLQTHEAALTGESEPILKITDAIAQPDVALGDRRNMAYAGTFVTAGRGHGVVTGTGMRTELGGIATLIQGVRPEPTPLQRRLDQLGKGLAGGALFLVAVIFVLGLLRGEDVKFMFVTAVSIAVAAVPEGLPAVVTISLAIGAKRMLQRRVLIRKLAAVETLGSVTVICSDKTGTLTQNRMTAVLLRLADESLEPGPGGGKRLLTTEQSGFGLLLSGGALCNDAFVQGDSHSQGRLGDPTEMALADAAARFGLMKQELERVLPRIAEIPFSSERKRMTTIHRVPSSPGSMPFDLDTGSGRERPGFLVFTKGAVDVLLNISNTVRIRGKIEPLTKDARDRLTSAHDGLAKNGMRVLGVAFRELRSIPPVADDSIERDLTFAGMIGIIDPPRPEVAAAVSRCKTAGIRVVMITGDHPLTARYIAAQLGIDGEGTALTGFDLDRLSVSELERLAESVPVYSRVSPAHKLKIIEGLQRRGHIVAMTGDGVNDAPALKKSDIGVAMGITGTDVAKEAADIVLLDDDFATIVAAVEEGRVIYDNIRKFVRYIVTTNTGEILLMLAAPLMGMPLPMLPLQILWMNLVTDGLPALALGLEPAESDTMRRPPYPPNESIFSRGLGRHVIWVAILMAILSMAPGYWYWRAGDPNWRTLIFTTLTFAQMGHIMAIRSERQSLFKIGPASNRFLLGAVGITVGLQLALVYAPFLQAIFKTTSLSPTALALTVTVSGGIFAAVEAEKWFTRRESHRTR